MIEADFRNPLVPIRPVPNKRLARAAVVNDIPPRIVIITVGYLTRLGVNQRAYMPQRVAHIELHPPTRNPRHRSQRTPHILGAHLPISVQLGNQNAAVVEAGKAHDKCIVRGGSVLDRVGVCAVVRASDGGTGEMLNGLLELRRTNRPPEFLQSRS